jgi:hypothetical protein
MTSSGRNSLLVDSPLRTLAHAMNGLDTEVRRQIGQQTKAAAQPIWLETTRAHATDRMQVRLADSATVGVTTQNVFLRAGTKGALSSGTPVAQVAHAIAFGANPNKMVKVAPRNAAPYQRRMGTRFRPPRRGGYVIYPAAHDSIPRFASLWVQTTHRTIHDTIEQVH